MQRRIPILLLLALLAGMIMGLIIDGFAQQAGGFGIVRVGVGHGGGFLGVSVTEVKPEDVDRLGMPEEYGARLTRIVPDSPAAEAGLQEDDVIVRWNGIRVESAMQLRRHLRETPPGRTVQLVVFRNGREMTVTVELGKRSDSARELVAEAFELKLDEATREATREALEEAMEGLHGWPQVYAVSRRGRMGVTLQKLTPQLAEYFGLKDRSGALIASVRERSPAEKAGLKAGDIILAIDGETVGDPGDAGRIIARKREGPVQLTVFRDGREMSFTVTLESRTGSISCSWPESLDLQLNLALPPLPAFAIPEWEPFDDWLRLRPVPNGRVAPLERFGYERVSPGVI